MATAVDWFKLPLELLNLVVSRFGIPHDFERFKSVCSSWGSSAVAPEQLPRFLRPTSRTVTRPQFVGLMLSGNEAGRRDFYSPLDHKVYKNLLRVPDGHLFVGNRDGRLITIIVRPSTWKFCLLNPLSGDVQIVRSPVQVIWSARKAVLSANIPTISDQTTTAPGGPPTMAVIYGIFRRLAYAREGAKAWVVVEEVGTDPYEDVIYYRDGFYAVTGLGTVFFVDVNCRVPPRVREVVPAPQVPSYRKYLVESQDGKLLLVSRYGDAYYDLDKIEFGKTLLFEVYQLDLKNQRRIRIRDLGDESLFVCVNTSLSIPSPEKFGLRKNCIYFIAKFPDVVTEIFRESDMGRFDLGTENSERVYALKIYENEPQTVWITL